MQEWLWDNHFAAVASDQVRSLSYFFPFVLADRSSQPAFEAWPPAEGEVFLHSTIIGCYGSPIGEFFDCEGASTLSGRADQLTT